MATTELIEHKRYAGKGRPSAKTTNQSHRVADSRPSLPGCRGDLAPNATQGCFVLGTNIDADNLSDEEGIAAYKAQSQVASGFRFLKDALFIVLSLFVKKPSWIQGLLMVMTLAIGWRNVACDRN